MEYPDRKRSVLTRAERGFTLVEVLTAIVVVVVLAAVTVPTMIDRLRQNEANASISELENIQTGIALFQRDVGRYPYRLDYLSVLFDSVSVRDLCGVAIPAANQARYRGPYITRPIVPVSPYTAPINTRGRLGSGDSIETLLSKVASGSGSAIQLSIKGPGAQQVTLMDSLADGRVDALNGRVRYTTPLQSRSNTLNWLIPVSPTGC
jgi:prepilin-type N-terminal cleavage/methylation domain-containing protein